MSAATHTPGPWTAEKPQNFREDDLRCDFIIREPGGGRIAHVPRGPDANAHLITAAPELMRIVETVFAHLNADTFSGDVPDQIHAACAAAIAKALGASIKEQAA